MEEFLLEQLEDLDILELGRGQIISKEEINLYKGDFPVYSSSATGNGEFGRYGKYMFDDERITWSIDGGGRLFYRPPHRYSVTNVCGWIKVKQNDVLLTRYVYYSLYYQWLLKKFDYTYKAHPSVIRKQYKIKLIPINEQKLIIEELSQIESILNKTRRELTVFDEVIKTRFVELFGDPVQNTGNYKTKQLATLGYFSRGKSKHRPRNDSILLGGPYPLIQTSEIANADTYINDYEQTYSEYGLKQSKMWKKGTLCITIAANIAKTAILNIDACFPDSIIGFIPYNEVDTLFMHHWFSFFQPILEEQAPAAAQKNLNGATLGKVEVIVPPIELQQQFAEFVKQIEKLKNNFKKQIALFEELLEAKMREYFN